MECTAVDQRELGLDSSGISAIITLMSLSEHFGHIVEIIW